MLIPSNTSRLTSPPPSRPANLELASLPTTTPEERKRLLSFVVCGGGPTGVEFAAELADMMDEDVLNYVRRRNVVRSMVVDAATDAI